MRFISLFLCLGLTPLLVSAQSLTASPASTTPYKAYRIHLTGEYFKPTARFDLEGNQKFYDGNEDFRFAQSQLRLSYGWTNRLEIFGGARMRYVESMDFDGDSLSNSGMESVFGGIKYGFPNWIDNWRFSVEALYRQTSYTNEEFAPLQASGNNIILGDDGSSFKLGMHAARNRFIMNSQFRGYLAYHRPANQLSQEILYDVSLNWFRDQWLFGGGFEGIYSLGLDDFEAEPGLKPDMNTGTTNLFNSINREKFEPYAVIGRQLSGRSHVDLRVSQVMQGKSTDEGTRFLLAFTWGSQGVSDAQRRVESFKEYSVEASVIKVSPRGAFVQIDKGLGQDVDKGMRFDIYQTDFLGKNELVASGVVYEVSASSAIIRLSQRYNETIIEPGFRARGN